MSDGGGSDSQDTMFSDKDELSQSSSHASKFSSTGSLDPSKVRADQDREAVNKALAALNVSPVTAKKLKEKEYPIKKVNQIADAVKSKLNIDEPDSCELSEILEQMKGAFVNANKHEKYQLLTLLPRSWSLRKMQKEFGISSHMARNAKQLQDAKGPMSSPDQKMPGNKLSTDTISAVLDFYNKDSVSRAMPGKKDCISVKIAGKREKVQKRLILCTLREAYFHFKDQNPGIKIGLSKFIELRPKHVVLPGGSGTHTVCVCVYHQNPKLMMAGSQICSSPEFRKIVDPSWTSEVKVQHLLARLVCNPAQEACWFGECLACKEFASKLKEELLDEFEKLDVENITFKTWVSTDRTELLTVTQEVGEFLDSFVEKLEVLKTHDFIYRQQACYFSELKDNLSEDSCISVGDFSENYTFLIQDAVQGNHWSKDQATLHPFVCYANVAGVVTMIPVLFISDHLTHDTVAVYAFQRRLNELLDDMIGERKKQYYFSDGCGKQYKNKKNFLNLTFHGDDFGPSADWNFFATAHGKGCWDGLAGSVKRQAVLESLRRPVDGQLLTPDDLFKFAKDKFPGMVVEFVASEEILRIEREVLAERFKAAKTIKGTLKLHQFNSIADSKTHLNVKEYSMCDTTKKVKIAKT